MITTFLSHSSKDKGRYVKLVADKLKNNNNIVYDEYTFESGNKILDEIIENMDNSQLFVFFISEDSLESSWVKKEILLAESKLNKNLKCFYPIIIDENILYSDKRIPKWIQEAYTLKYVSRPTIATRRIEQKIREIILNKHQKLEERENLCIGRNQLLDDFEERIDDFELKKPKCIISSGFNSIGRRTFIKHALIKTNLIKQYYKPNSIYLDINDSIEDFIIKLLDLGFSDINDETKNLLSKEQTYKINLAIKLLKDIQEQKEILIILDNGSIVNYERRISGWFKKIIESEQLENNILICTASKYKINRREHSNNFYSINIDDLTIPERKRLFARLLEINQIEISKEEYDLISKQFHGFPEQIIFTVDLIKRESLRYVINNLYLIREFNDEKASTLIRHYRENDFILSFIRLIAQFEIISLDLLYNIVDFKEYNSILERLITENICEYIGYDGQFLRLNDSIRDYIIRNKLEIKEEFKNKIKEHVIDFIKNENIEEKDSSDYLFSIKEAILNEEEVNENLLLPSHFLRTMKDLYNQRKYKKVIQLADKVLEKKDFIDKYLITDIRYFLCLALIKTKNKRVLNEVQNLNGDQHNFILGYYYRTVGRYIEALELLKKVVDSKYIQSRAKREIVHIFIQTEGYSKALKYARDNYIENKNNIFHVQLYFTCLIHSDDFFHNKEELKRLVKELEEKSLEVNSDMGHRAKALYLAKCEDNEIESLNIINDAIEIFKDSHYPILTKFDIAFIFKNIEEMKNAIRLLDSIHENISKRTYIKQKAYLLAIEEHSDVKAKQLINDELKNYPQELKDLINEKIDKLSKNFLKN